jgi:hypothetical protein
VRPETETIDRLFLELSQFTTATTAKELALEQQLARIKEHGCLLNKPDAEQDAPLYCSEVIAKLQQQLAFLKSKQPYESKDWHDLVMEKGATVGEALASRLAWKQATARVKELEAHDAERREAHAFLTGKFETGWCMTHPDGKAVTALGKAAQQATAQIERLREALMHISQGSTPWMETKTITDTPFELIMKYAQQALDAARATSPDTAPAPPAPSPTAPPPEADPTQTPQ